MRVIQSEHWTVAIIEEGERSLGRKRYVNGYDLGPEIEIYDRKHASAYENEYRTWKYGQFASSYCLDDFMSVDCALSLDGDDWVMPAQDVKAIQVLILEG